MRGRNRMLLVMWCLATLLFVFSEGTALACAVMDDCCYGFTRLRHNGDVTGLPVDGEVTFGDDGFVLSYLFSFYNPGPGSYTIDLDIKNDLSDTPYPNYSPPFAFLDTFYASLMFRDDSDGDDCDTCYDWTPLFDMDATGPFNAYGEFSPGSIGEEWMHFTMTFENTHPYVITAFELVDWNGIDDDSELILANVCIARVPLPPSILLLASGLLGTLAVCRRRNRPPSTEQS